MERMFMGRSYTLMAPLLLPSFPGRKLTRSNPESRTGRSAECFHKRDRRHIGVRSTPSFRTAMAGGDAEFVEPFSLPVRPRGSGDPGRQTATFALELDSRFRGNERSVAFAQLAYFIPILPAASTYLFV